MVAGNGAHVLKSEGLIKVAETAATVVLLTTAHVGLPVSTTHTLTSSILGVGATRRLSAVRWGIAGKILTAWIFTLPCTALLAYLIIRVVDALGS